METKTAIKKTSRKKTASPKTARKKSAAAPKSVKKARKAAPPKKAGAIESIGYAAGATVGKITSIAGQATRAIKNVADKVIDPKRKM